MIVLKPTWFAAMDYMCEPMILQQLGWSVQQCIEKTIENAVEIGQLQEDIQHYYEPEEMEQAYGEEYEIHKDWGNYIPVLQGWTVEDYLECVDLFRSNNLFHAWTSDPRVAVGSVCRRNKEQEILTILRAIRKAVPKDVKIHAFGIKLSLLKFPEIYSLIDSCDSHAWNFYAMYNPPECPDCIHPEWTGRWKCSHCFRAAQVFLERVQALITKTQKQMRRQTKLTHFR